MKIEILLQPISSVFATLEWVSLLKSVFLIVAEFSMLIMLAFTYFSVKSQSGGRAVFAFSLPTPVVLRDFILRVKKI